MDGQLIDWADAKVHVLTHTLHYGLGVFEGVRAYSTPEGTKIFRLNDHTKRLFESAKAVNIFDLYFDTYGKGALQSIDYGKGTISPGQWGYKSPSDTKKKKRR